VLTRADTALARDGGADAVLCSGRATSVTADGPDATVGCGRGVRRRGVARPGFTQLPSLDAFGFDEGVAASLGCPDDMRATCRLRAVLRSGRTVLSSVTAALRPGRRTARVLKIRSAAAREAVCAGRRSLAVTVTGRDARRRAVTLCAALRVATAAQRATCRC
jgi:hypothetical protein